MTGLVTAPPSPSSGDADRHHSRRPADVGLVPTATVGGVKQAGSLIASGRDSDIFECGPGLVLRRARNQRSLAAEARTMEYARAQGYPVPAIDEISDDGTDLVMERIDGPSMLDALTRRPWTLRHHAGELADLHQRLHEIPGPEWLRPAPFGDGPRLLHLDLHPLNVIMSANGPVVIDWPNAGRGDGDADVAVTWALMACAGIPSGRVMAALLGRLRSVLVNSFLRGFDLASVRRQLARVVEWKVADANLTEAERQAMRRLVRTAGAT